MPRKSIQKAARLYRTFREREPRRVKRLNYYPPRTLTTIGYADAIEYSTTHGKKRVPYRHEFAPGSRPLMCADPDTGKLYFVGGRYRFTSRGIVDLNHQRREQD